MTPQQIDAYWLLAAATAGAVAGSWTLRRMLHRDRIRRQINHLEKQINNPNVRARYLNHPRREDTP